MILKKKSSSVSLFQVEHGVTRPSDRPLSACLSTWGQASVCFESERKKVRSAAQRPYRTAPKSREKHIVSSQLLKSGVEDPRASVFPFPP